MLAWHVSIVRLMVCINFSVDDLHFSRHSVFEGKIPHQQVPNIEDIPKGVCFKKRIPRTGAPLSVCSSQRSATAIEAFVRDLLKDPIQHVSSEQDLIQRVHAEVSTLREADTQRNHQAVTGRFASPESPTLAVFTRVAETLRDECLFVAHSEYTGRNFV
jgi:hypothetical protein